MRLRSTAGWFLLVLSLALVFDTGAAYVRGPSERVAPAGGSADTCVRAPALGAAQAPSHAGLGHAWLRAGATAITAGGIGETLRSRVETGCRTLARFVERAAARATEARVRTSLTHRTDILALDLVVRSIRLGREAHHTTAPPSHA